MSNLDIILDSNGAPEKGGREPLEGLVAARPKEDH
jgi:hypothetical protein